MVSRILRPGEMNGIALATSAGREIFNVRRLQRSSAEMIAAEAYVKKLVSSAKTRSRRSTYNCFGMVFASRRSIIPETDELLHFLNDDGYVRVPSKANVEIGDIAIYKQEDGDITHAAVVIEKRYDIENGNIRLTVLSQFGLDGEYFHDVDDVPKVYGNSIEFYSDTK